APAVAAFGAGDSRGLVEPGVGTSSPLFSAGRQSFGPPQHAAQFGKELERIVTKDLPTDSHCLLLGEFAALDLFSDRLGDAAPRILSSGVNAFGRYGVRSPHNAVGRD